MRRPGRTTVILSPVSLHTICPMACENSRWSVAAHAQHVFNFEQKDANNARDKRSKWRKMSPLRGMTLRGGCGSLNSSLGVWPKLRTCTRGQKTNCEPTENRTRDQLADLLDGGFAHDRVLDLFNVDSTGVGEVIKDVQCLFCLLALLLESASAASKMRSTKREKTAPKDEVDPVVQERRHEL